MPRLNSRLDVLMGIGDTTLTVNGAAWARGGGGDWLDESTVVAQIFRAPAWEVCALTSPTARLPVTSPPQPASTVYAGGGQWAFWRLSTGVSTSLGNPWGADLARAGLAAVGADGTIVIVPDYQTGRDLRLLRPDGTSLLLPVGPARAVHMPSADRLLYTRGDRLHAWGTGDPLTVSGPCYNPRAVPLPSGDWWLSYHTATRWLLQPWTEPRGYVLRATPDTYRPDLGVIDAATLRCVASRTEAEGAAQLLRVTQSLTAPRVWLDPSMPEPLPPNPPPPTLAAPGVQILAWAPIDADKTGLLVQFLDRNNPQFGTVTVTVDGGYIRVEIVNTAGRDRSSKKDRKVI